MNADILERGQIPAAVAAVVAEQPLVDLHTHLYPPGFGTPVPSAAGRTDPAGLMLWGIDELVTYHYLIAEVYRVVPPSQLPYEQFWKMTRSQQADHVWKHLFVERSPLSEACRGILTTLHRLGLDPNVKDLASLRPFFLQQDPDRYIDRVMELAGIERITMTNAVFDDNERQRWLSGARVKDARFRAVLRIDPMLRDWPTAACRLNEWGFSVEPEITGRTVEEARRFLREWIDRIEAVYLAVSLPPEFRYPAAGGELPPSPLAGEGLGVRGLTACKAVFVWLLSWQPAQVSRPVFSRPPALAAVPTDTAAIRACSLPAPWHDSQPTPSSSAKLAAYAPGR
jgi:hypothetical protein